MADRSLTRMAPSPGHPPLTPKQRLALIAGQVEQWRTMTGQLPPVEPGSSLTGDDQIFLLLPPSYLIWHGISHAVDHLDMFMNALVMTNTSFPLAPQTLARSGVLGAAHALWMLDGPDRVERQLRALRMVHQEFSQERTAYRDIVQIEGPNPRLASLIAVRDKWIARTITAGATIGKTAKQVAQRPDDTTLIDSVIKRYEQVNRPEDGGSLVGVYRLIWRMHSGVAHGLRWPIMYRTDFSNAVLGGDEHGLGGMVTNDEDQLMVSATAMYLLLKRAFELYDLRRLPHHA